VLATVGARWGLASSILVGSLMHAAGHAFLAAAAGALARSLAGEIPVAGRSTPRAFTVLASVAEPADAILAVAVAGVLAALAKMVGGALASWAEARVAGDVGARVRLAVLDRVLAVQRTRAPRQRDHGGTHGERLAALTSHVHDVERGVAHGVLAEGRALVQLVPLAVLLAVLAPELAGSAALALGAFGLLAFLLRRAFKRAHQEAVASAGVLAGAADEAVRHAELWATYGARQRIRDHLAGLGRAIAREAAALRVRASLLSSTSEVLGALALLLVLLLASRGALGVDHGTVVPFAIAFFMAYRPLREVVDARLVRARGDEALAQALGGEAERAAAPAAPRAEWDLEPLVLEAVSSAHGAHAPLSITVPAGAIVAVVGPTGAGKTSLLRVLLGLDAPTAGSIRYGERTLTSAGVGPAERPFAWVPQDAPVVGDTLANNVDLGRGDAGGAPSTDVLEALGASGLATSLGAAVLVAERAVSGGERQWIAVARALASGLPVLLLDEPTSALDGAAEARLLEAIARLRGRRTVLLVTHRPAPLAVADIVIRLEA
jgi:ABC-type multidrug transport system fused ATPase/permease subunit